MSDFNATASAIIRPDGINPPAIYSKFYVTSSYKGTTTDPALPIRLNINSDVTVVLFRSQGANDKPPKQALTLKYNDINDVTGFASINGIIGAGQITFTASSENGSVTISGPIEGGPKGKQSFVGSGTWTSG